MSYHDGNHGNRLRCGVHERIKSRKTFPCVGKFFLYHVSMKKLIIFTDGGSRGNP